MNNERDLLKIAIVGNVDDGKSTLIGRFFLDSKSIYEDQLLAMEEAAKRRGQDQINLAFLTDGLKEERSRGITIDVSYRYFSTPKRKFILIDCPGHFEFTKNMVTGISNADVVAIIIDATLGITEQTRRHAYLLNLFQFKNIIVAINKMDLVGYSKDVFDKIQKDFINFSKDFKIDSISYIPISALLGANIVHSAKEMSWYQEGTFIEFLEKFSPRSKNEAKNLFAIQDLVTINDEEYILGKVISGDFHLEDKVYDENQNTFEIKKIFKGKIEVKNACEKLTSCFKLDKKSDLLRGSLLLSACSTLKKNNSISVTICWLGEETTPFDENFTLKFLIKEATCRISKIVQKIKISDEVLELDRIKENDIFLAIVEFETPQFYFTYEDVRDLGQFIFVNQLNKTVAFGIINE